jgi:hypothetical protein
MEGGVSVDAHDMLGKDEIRATPKPHQLESRA